MYLSSKYTVEEFEFVVLCSVFYVIHNKVFDSLDFPAFDATTKSVLTHFPSSVPLSKSRPASFLIDFILSFLFTFVLCFLFTLAV